MELRVIDAGVVDYPAALQLQEDLVAGKIAGKAVDYLVLLEHPPVYTCGRGGREPVGIPVFRVNRGGDVTFHGPGQLVGYPIIDFRCRERDVHRYVRRLEDVLICALREFDVPAERNSGWTGVWLPPKSRGEKIASIGIGVRRWITFHGFALNVNTDLSYFDAIMPCGLTDVRMTSMARVLGKTVSLPAVKREVVRYFIDEFYGDRSD